MLSLALAGELTILYGQITQRYKQGEPRVQVIRIGAGHSVFLGAVMRAALCLCLLVIGARGYPEGFRSHPHSDFSVADNVSENNLTVQAAEKLLLERLPQWKQETFLERPYNTTDWLLDTTRQEALGVGSALGMMAVATWADHLVRPVAGALLGKYGVLASDFAVDALTSDSWEELGYRSGVNAASWLISDHVAYVPFLLRYLVSHGALLKETWPDIWQTLLPQHQGERVFQCTHPDLCAAVKLTYHLPNNDYSPDTGQPWLSFTFPYGVHEPVPENSQEQVLLDLRHWAHKQGAEAVHLYPDDDDGHLKLWVRVWDRGTPGKLLRVPGSFGVGAGGSWWTSVMASRYPLQELQRRRLVNPLDQSILDKLLNILNGEEVSPVRLRAREQVLASAGSLVAVPAGEEGFLLFDRHSSRHYQLPEIWLDSTLPLNRVTAQSIRNLALRRPPAPVRGATKLVASVVRSTLQKAAFEWGVSKLRTEPEYQPPEETKQDDKADQRNNKLEESRDGDTRTEGVEINENIQVEGIVDADWGLGAGNQRPKRRVAAVPTVTVPTATVSDSGTQVLPEDSTGTKQSKESAPAAPDLNSSRADKPSPQQSPRGQTQAPAPAPEGQAISQPGEANSASKAGNKSSDSVKPPAKQDQQPKRKQRPTSELPGNLNIAKGDRVFGNTEHNQSSPTSSVTSKGKSRVPHIPGLESVKRREANSSVQKAPVQKEATPKAPVKVTRIKDAAVKDAPANAASVNAASANKAV